MATQVHFEQIKEQIIQQLNTADISIKVAVAWFTDADLFDLLCKKAKSGVNVELILTNDSINHNSNINYNRLLSCGGKLFFIGNGTDDEPLMHHKFCVVDKAILITGSYNWTNRAKFNHENITITNDEINIIRDYDDEFDKLKQQRNLSSNHSRNSKTVWANFENNSIKAPISKTVVSKQLIETKLPVHDYKIKLPSTNYSKPETKNQNSNSDILVSIGIIIMSGSFIFGIVDTLSKTHFDLNIIEITPNEVGEVLKNNLMILINIFLYIVLPIYGFFIFLGIVISTLNVKETFSGASITVFLIFILFFFPLCIFLIPIRLILLYFQYRMSEGFENVIMVGSLITYYGLLIVGSYRRKIIGFLKRIFAHRIFGL